MLKEVQSQTLSLFSPLSRLTVGLEKLHCLKETGLYYVLK